MNRADSAKGKSNRMANSAEKSGRVSAASVNRAHVHRILKELEPNVSRVVVSSTETLVEQYDETLRKLARE